jgi:hypothetical protein
MDIQGVAASAVIVLRSYASAVWVRYAASKVACAQGYQVAVSGGT